MAKINKYANLYDKDGNLIRKVNDKGVLENYSIAELEALIDIMTKSYEENPGQVSKFALDYANNLLMQLYMKHGNPHEAEILAKLKEQYGDDKSTQELVASALNDLNKEITEKPTVMEEYVEPIEEPKNVDEQRDTEPSNA